MDPKEVFRKLKDNPELARSIEEAIMNKVDASEFYGILIQAGFEAEDANVAMAEYQRRRGLALADYDVDEEMLRKVAGGGCGKCTEAADCDSNFKDPRYWDEDRCTFAGLCDEVYYFD